MSVDLVLSWAAMASGATLASWLGSVAGSGGTAILLPVLVAFLGPRDAIPVLTLCNVSGNASRSWINRSELDFRVVRWFVLGGLPMTLLGAYLFTQTTPELLLKILGAFLIFMVGWRVWARRTKRREWQLRSPRAFAPVGGFFGFLYGFTEGVGPLMAPFFLAFGLIRGAYIGTDALGTFILQCSKLIAFGHFDVLSAKILIYGLSLAPFMVLGSWLGKRTMVKVSGPWFTRIVETSILCSGIAFLVR